MSGPIIDMWAPILPTQESVEWIADNFPQEQLQYLEVFSKRRLSATEFAAYAAGLARSDEQIRADLSAAGITLSLISGFDERSSCGQTFVANQVVAAVAQRFGERVIAFAGADVLAGERALESLDYWIGERGFAGLSLRPFMIGRPATDAAYAPLLERCAALGVPVSIHSSANWTRQRPSELGHPRYIDEIACRYPELSIIMSHAGYPWVLEAVLVAWKHPHVYLELGAHRPRYFAAAGAGWEPLMRFGASTIADKVLFGSGAFLINRPYAQLTAELGALPLPAPVLDGWLYGNAARLLGR